MEKERPITYIHNQDRLDARLGIRREDMENIVRTEHELTMLERQGRGMTPQNAYVQSSEARRQLLNYRVGRELGDEVISDDRL